MNGISQTNTIQERKDFLPLLALPENHLVFNNFEGNTGCFSCCPDIFLSIFWQCLGNGDKTTLLNLRCLNKFHHILLTKFANQEISLKGLFAHCGKIEVLEQEAFYFVNVIPKILGTNLDSLKDIEKEAGSMAFYYKERTLDELVSWGEKSGVNVIIQKRILEEDRKLPKEEPHFCIATQGIFKKSRNKTPDTLMSHMEVERGCQMLTARKAVYIFLRTLEFSDGKKRLFARYPGSQWTYTYTSTPHGDPLERFFLVVGGSISNRFSVTHDNAPGKDSGACGQWKFEQAFSSKSIDAPIKFCSLW